jgi:hypothetical protein
MSLGELAIYPQRKQRALKRGLRDTKNRTKKSIQQKMKKAQRRTLAYLRSQYYVTSSLRDARYAASRNEDIFIASLMLIVAVLYALVTTGTNIIFAFMQAAATLSDMFGFSIALLVLAATGVLTAIFGWASIFMMNMLATTLMEGANRKVKRSVRDTVSKSLRATPRVANAWLALATKAFGPAGILMLVSFLVLHGFGVPVKELIGILAVLSVLSIYWIGRCLARYSLAPLIALFEPKIEGVAAFERSFQLVESRGRTFVTLGYLSVVAASAAAYGMSLLLQLLLHIDSILPFTLSLVVIIFAAQSGLAMFYRKRKLARS